MQQRANQLKEEVHKMLGNVKNHPLQEINLIDAIQRLGVAYHFEKEITDALLRMYNEDKEGNYERDDLHTVALRFRLLRQEGNCVSSDVFIKFKYGKGNFKETLAGNIRGLVSLYKASHFVIHGEDILDEANAFATKHLKLALPNLNSPLSSLVQLALELPLHKSIERLLSRYYISIYQEEDERNDILLEFAKFDFNLLQSLHQEEIREISKWDRSIVEQLPDVMKLHFLALLDAIDKFEEELALEEKILSYLLLKRCCTKQNSSFVKIDFKEISKSYLIEARWSNTGYVPTYEEYMSVALVTCGYKLLTLISFVGMGDIATKEAFEWARSMPKLIKAVSMVNRLRDDITSNKV
ncbi:terpene synthase 1 [Cinnamomum micranthum f. kanehirae]|uniref:Terpene synthase 1 n=1 Tax=Cinnamomum micranthum f. kanehirae TaxID=337451 RepID=A0A3S3MXR3_9MAGN|nr:terpene synthase 1 [Cinnamomum micranthum f. kanehirae]